VGAEARVRGGHYKRLHLRISRTASVPDLEFLDQGDRIKELDIGGPVQDDTYAFGRTDVRSLLLTRCRRRIPDTDLGHLEKLAIDNRPHYEQIHDLPQLTWLALFGGLGGLGLLGGFGDFLCGPPTDTPPAW
jgi:hypothetical protein